jgi:hypothetical protein
MVNAILEGRKTQTRRPIKPLPLWVGEPNVPFKTIYADPKGIIKEPYKKGDILYVRETWRGGNDTLENVFYKADLSYSSPAYQHMGKWKPSIHMPKTFARIFLQVANVRVERVQDISEEDCLKEGLKLLHGGIRSEYAYIWNSIYKNWIDNPYVWVIEFKTIEGVK